jgi:peptidoglycan/xylan/chitin deacetylase (PgdA/CDA1 family)
MPSTGKTDSIPILTYHSVDDSDSVISVSPDNFKKQMRFLWRKGYGTLSLSNAIDCIRRGDSFPSGSLVVTFDDGYRNNYTAAFPVLQEFGYCATVFLTTQHCGRTNNWPDQHPSIPELPMLSWDEIKEMTAHGIEFGAHTRNHPNLTEVNTEIARREIIESKNEMEEKMGQSVELFSYPFGRFNAEVQAIVKAAFAGAISNKPGKISSRSDLHALERINTTGRIFKGLPISISSLGSFNCYLILKRSLDTIL